MKTFLTMLILSMAFSICHSQSKKPSKATLGTRFIFIQSGAEEVRFVNDGLLRTGDKILWVRLRSDLRFTFDELKLSPKTKYDLSLEARIRGHKHIRLGYRIALQVRHEKPFNFKGSLALEGRWESGKAYLRINFLDRNGFMTPEFLVIARQKITERLAIHARYKLDPARKISGRLMVAYEVGDRGTYILWGIHHEHNIPQKEDFFVPSIGVSMKLK